MCQVKMLSQNLFFRKSFYVLKLIKRNELSIFVFIIIILFDKRRGVTYVT